MARISPTPGSEIRFSDILSKMGLSQSDRSFDSTEVTAMGGATEADLSLPNSICMPYQKEAIASLGSTGTRGYEANWTHLTGITNWRPTRMSEFRNAYNNKPQVIGNCTGNGTSTSCNMEVVGSNSDAYTSSSTPYYFRITGSGEFEGQNVWVQANSADGKKYTTTVTTLPGGAGSFVVRVCDYDGCGNRSEINYSFSY
jgi:hypothetical protein